MRNHPLICGLLLTGLLACCSGEAEAAENPDLTNAPLVRQRRGNPSNKAMLDKRTEEFRQKSETAFDKLLALLKPYGSEPSKVFNTGREISAQYRTNRQGGITIEVGVRSDTHQASFIAGPVDARGEHLNPSLPEGPLLTQLASLYDGSDIRRNPSATNTWYQATGKWSEADAVAETLRLAHALGHQTNRVTRTEFVAVPLHLKNPSGTDVVVTPFYKVDLYNANDSRLLGVEYRIGSEPPGKVTRWFNWPPIKVP